MEKNINYMNVKCISSRDNTNQIVVGNLYVLDRATIYIDSDGDAFGVIYDKNMNRIGNLLLKHFMSV